MKFSRGIIILLCFGFFLIGGARVIMILSSQKAITELENTPHASVALVLGAGLNRDGTPSLPLRDRLNTALDLYQAGKVDKLLLSGDNSRDSYNEPGAMQTYLLEAGVPKEDLVLDYAGRRTYDSCYRAKQIFGLSDLIVVTQTYHLHRAVFLCSQLGLDTTGVPADQSYYLRNRYLFWNFREIFASIAAYWDISIRKPIPILGEFEPIFEE